jgi:MFS family permease
MPDRWLALALIFLTRVSMSVQFQSIASVGPLVVDDLRLSYAQLGTLVGLYLLPGVALALPGGLVGRRFGERR